MKRNRKIIALALTAAFAAVICILSPLSIPIGAVPISLSVFAVACVAAVIGRKSCISVLLYIVIGAAGLPVFAKFAAGLGVITGATGGYIIGYIPLALMIGAAADSDAKLPASVLLYAGGLFCCYTLGTAWFMFVTESSLKYALSVCVIPFISPDAIKLVAAGAIGSRIRKAVLKHSEKA
ncbi:MAG: biotin transporter BioY [Clostridiales bacterium]|nr:biotin transporter BioY [Clostridiales bacterium]